MVRERIIVCECDFERELFGRGLEIVGDMRLGKGEYENDDG